VLRYAPDGTFLSQFATGGMVSSWLAVYGSDNIYVVDDNRDRVRTGRCSSATSTTGTC
jgi:hypothetical protein